MSSQCLSVPAAAALDEKNLARAMGEERDKDVRNVTYVHQSANYVRCNGI